MITCSSYPVLKTILRNVKQSTQIYISKTWNQISKIKSLNSTTSILSSISLFGSKRCLTTKIILQAGSLFCCSYISHIVPISMFKNTF